MVLFVHEIFFLMLNVAYVKVLELYSIFKLLIYDLLDITLM